MSRGHNTQRTQTHGQGKRGKHGATCLGPRGRRAAAAAAAAAAAGGRHGHRHGRRERWSVEGTVRRAGAKALGGIDTRISGRAAATAI